MWNIPENGMLIRLTEDWEVPIYHERRNHTVLRQLHSDWDSRDGWAQNDSDTHSRCVFPKGTELRIDRVYIRKGRNYYRDIPNSDFNSLTFIVEHSSAAWFTPNTPKKGFPRFWAKVDDCSQICMHPVAEGVAL